MNQKFSAIVSLPWNKGQKKIGTEQGAQWIAQYVETQLKYTTNEFFVDQTQDISTNFRRMYEEIIKHPAPYIFCGGDHSEAISTVLSVVNNQKYVGKKIGLLWVDAHADINTYEQSNTKNYHGMPLSFICGIDTTFDWVNKLKKLPTENLIYYGLRDVDDYEQNLIKERKIKSILTEDSYQQIFDWFKNEKIEVAFVSFDIDSIDPIDIPSTGTIAPNGIRKDKAKQFFVKLRQTFADLNIEWNIEVVEFNPLIGGEVGRKTTQDNLREILDSIFK